MWQRIVGFLLGLLILALFGFILLYTVLHAARFISSLEQPLVVAILAASATIMAATITVVVGKVFERKTEIEAHFRERKVEQYFDLLKLMSDLAAETEKSNIDANVKRLNEWQRKLILFAGPTTVRHFVAWFNNLKSGNHTLTTIKLMEDFYKSLRSDIGISNRGLRDGDLVQLVLRHGDLYVAMWHKNPNMPLAQLVALEKQLEEEAAAKQQAPPI